MRQCLAVLIGLSAASVSGALAQTPAPPSFATYVSIGDSLAAGVSNGSLVETHQANSVPALVARQTGASDFQQPLISQPGVPPELVLVSLSPAPVIVPRSATPGAPRNLGLPRSYNNLAVPGASVVDAVTRASDDGGAHDLVLRGRGTQLAQAVALDPTFVTVWIGNNDVLGAAIRATAIPGVTLTPTDVFRAHFEQVISTLKTTRARIVAANVPDVTLIPFVSTIPPYVVNPVTNEPVLIGGQPVPLLGPNGPLPANAKVTIAAVASLVQGIGIPTALGGRGTGLPDEVVLDAGEIAVIQEHVRANNAAIQQICQAAGVPVVDLFALVNEAATTGRSIGGIDVTTDFLTGGLVGLDGVHPTDLGNAVIANEWIRVINANGGTVPLVDLGPYFGVSDGGVRASSAGRAAASRLAWPQMAGPALEGLFTLVR